MSRILIQPDWKHSTRNGENPNVDRSKFDYYCSHINTQYWKITTGVKPMPELKSKHLYPKWMRHATKWYSQSHCWRYKHIFGWTLIRKGEYPSKAEHWLNRNRRLAEHWAEKENTGSRRMCPRNTSHMRTPSMLFKKSYKVVAFKNS